jgi:hypothetical protein
MPLFSNPPLTENRNLLWLRGVCLLTLFGIIVEDAGTEFFFTHGAGLLSLRGVEHSTLNRGPLKG